MPLTAEKPATESIRAEFSYIVDTGVPPVRYIDWPEMEGKEVPPQYRQHAMSVRNGRPLRNTFELDTHGFVFVDHATQVKDFTDPAERARVYDLEVQALIKRHSGASEVVVFDHTIRIGDEQAQKASNARPTVKGVHNDYTERSAPRRLQEIQEALGDYPGVAPDPRQGAGRTARHLRRPHDSADGVHTGREALQGAHRRGLSHCVQPRAPVVLLPGDGAQRSAGVQGIRF